MKVAEPGELYTRACIMKKEQLDKYGLYAFRCAVVYARDPAPNPDKNRWWYYTDEKKKEKFGK